ncbi:MAG: hypothetical protein K2W33_17450 [Burkholderiales bacterium]|nr:hypothetical protein [Burkholderiales bacterium]
MTTAELSTHRSAMATLRIAHITATAEHRMQAQTAEEQLRVARADSHAYAQSPVHGDAASQRRFELCKYLVGV